MSTKTRLESTHDRVNRAQVVLDAADKTLDVAERATATAGKAKSRKGLFILLIVLAVLGVVAAKRKSGSDRTDSEPTHS